MKKKYKLVFRNNKKVLIQIVKDNNLHKIHIQTTIKSIPRIISIERNEK